MSGLLQNNLVLRILSALVLIPVALFAIYQGGLIFLIFLTVLYAACCYEWYQMARKTGRFIRWSVFGFVYLSLGFVCFYGIQKDLGIATAFVLVVWLGDIFAYVFGKFIGGPKLAPLISPNKTWAGLGGAMFGSFLALAFCFVPFLTGVTSGVRVGEGVIFFVALGAIFGVACQGGDLLVSYLKRKAGVKDSGALIPGHGGVLDRLDSMLLCAFCVVGVVFFVAAQI